MNCKDMMQIPELTEVLKLKAGKNGLQQSVRWIYFADCLQCVKSEYKIENYIHGEDGLMTARNKWLIAHEDAKIEGAFNGLKGENITLD